MRIHEFFELIEHCTSNSQRPNHPNGEETSEDSHKKKVRRISPAGRIGDEEGSGDLDLNATPLGFDLNAPVAEEDLLQAGSGWLSAQEEVVESKPDISEVEVKSPITVETEPLAQSRVKNEPFAGPESAQTAAVVKAEEAYEPQHLNSEEGMLNISMALRLAHDLVEGMKQFAL
jgi:hypothetical protein